MKQGAEAQRRLETRDDRSPDGMVLADSRALLGPTVFLPLGLGTPFCIFIYAVIWFK